MGDLRGTRVLTQNAQCGKKVVVNVGGARSSKSYSIAQLLLSKFTSEENKKFLITRKTMPALRVTALKVMVDLMQEYGRYGGYQHNKSESTIINPAKNNWMLFCSLDSPLKIKSTDFSYIHMEEANEFTFEDYIVFLTRLSTPVGEGDLNQMFLSCNPTDLYGWINKKLRLHDDVHFIHSSFRDNPFLDTEYIKVLEGLKEQDEAYYKIYALGEYAELEHIIYKAYKLDVPYPAKFEERIYGLDFGFNNPSALVRVQSKDQNYYLDEKLYRSKLTNQDLIDVMNAEQLIDNKAEDIIYCDSAEPDRIVELRRAGFNAKPAFKGKNSVKDGIDYCKRLNLITTNESTNLIEERAGYKYRENKDGEVLDTPVDFHNHLMDAKRYALYTHFGKKRKVGIINL